MTGLLDIAPVSSKVKVSGTEVEVFGISIGGLAQLLGRFPVLQTMFSGDSIDVQSILPAGNEIVAAIIAAGCGNANDRKAEEIASRLALAEQIDLLSAIITRTMPDGTGPLMARLEELGAALNLAAVEKPRTASLETSPEQLNGSLGPAIGQKMFGTMRPDGSLHSWPSQGNG